MQSHSCLYSLSIMCELPRFLEGQPSRFCEWTLVLTISHSKSPGEQRVTVCWVPRCLKQRDTWKWNKDITERIHVESASGSYPFQMLKPPKSCKTQLIHCPAAVFKKFRGAKHRTNNWNKHNWALYLTLMRGHKLPKHQLRPVCVTGDQESRRGARTGRKDQAPVSARFGKPSQRRTEVTPPLPPQKRPPSYS